MNIRMLAPLALLLLAACDGNPIGTGGEEPPVEPCTEDCPVQPDDPVVIPTLLGANLKAIEYDQDDDEFLITFTSLDTTPTIATWTRNTALEAGIADYRAYSVQEDELDRMFVGLARTSTDRGVGEEGSVTAIAAGDGGQFNRVFHGGTYARNGAWSAPVGTQADGSGQVSYAGTYAAITNIPAPRPGQILPVPPGTSGPIVPGQPSRVSGDIFINANFTDNTVNGAIYNRVLVDYNFGLQAVILVPDDTTPNTPGNIEANGSFTGNTERWIGDDPNMEESGVYGGVFGGVGATAVGGVVALTRLYRTDNGEILDGAIEHGVFVLDKCGTANDAAICDQVEPDLIND